VKRACFIAGQRKESERSVRRGKGEKGEKKKGKEENFYYL
jgi:hypothetical protein